MTGHNGAPLLGGPLTCRTTRGNIETIELARGCPQRCYFCSVGYMKRFRVLPEPPRASANGLHRHFAPDLGCALRPLRAAGVRTTTGGLRFSSALRHLEILRELVMPTMGLRGGASGSGGSAASR